MPFREGGAGGCLGLDLDPGTSGAAGRVVNVGGREVRKRVVAPGFTAFLAWVLRQFEAGNRAVAEEEGDPLREPPNAHVLDAVQSLSGRRRRRTGALTG